MPLINFEAEDFAPLVRQIVAETLTSMQSKFDEMGKRLAFTEEEAAEMIGLKSHQLRDERRRGRIQASQIVCRAIRYSREDILRYLMTNRINQPDT